MYAVMETGGKQYRVSAGEKLEVELLPVDAGQPFVFERVLLVSDQGKTTIGAPVVAGAKVLVDVVEHIRGVKKVIWKMRRRKGYHKKQGHRQELTVVQVREVQVGGVAPAKSETPAAEVSPIVVSDVATAAAPAVSPKRASMAQATTPPEAVPIAVESPANA